MEESNTLYTGFLFSIIGIVLGWILNQLSQWFRVRKDDKRKVKLVLFNLLETYFLFSRSDTDKYFDYYKKCFLSKVPKEIRSVVKQQFESAIDLNLIPNFITPDLIEESKKVRSSYESSINSLAEIDPILAYYLNGKTDILERFDKIEGWLDSISPNNEIEEEHFNTGVDKAMNIIKPDLVEETIDDLKRDVLKVAWKINPVVWFKARKALKRLERNANESIKKQINELVEKMVKEMEG